MSHSIVGFWKFKSNRIRQENGDWITENLSGGTMAFSEGGEAILLIRSEQGPWGYVGKYTFDGERVKIAVETSTADGVAGTTLQRQVKFMNDHEFTFTGAESHTERAFETHFVRA